MLGAWKAKMLWTSLSFMLVNYLFVTHKGKRVENDTDNESIYSLFSRCFFFDYAWDRQQSKKLRGRFNVIITVKYNNKKNRNSQLNKTELSWTHKTHNEKSSRLINTSINGTRALLTSSLDDLSWRGGVAGDAWLSRSGRTLLVRVPGVPRPLLSPPAPLPATPRFCQEREKHKHTYEKS